MTSIGGRFSKALVTGSAGFVGSHLIEELLGRGLDVVGVDDYSAGHRSNLNRFRDNPRFTEVDCDITDYKRLRAVFETGVDIVFHQAASKKTVCLRDPRRDLDVNAKGAFNLLELSRDFGIRKYVHASTGSVYGEPQYFPQDESHPLNPCSYYGVSKLAGERYAKAFLDLYGLDTTILRYFHVYGPRQEYSDVGGVVTIFGRRVHQGKPPVIFGDGTQQRSFTYVKDIAKINCLVAERPETKGEVYNCASGIVVTIRQLAEKVLAAYGREDLSIEYDAWTPGDIKVFQVDNGKIRSLGFEFMTDFDKGLGETIDWLRHYLPTEASETA